MKLLLVFPFIPYPPDDGGRIGFFNPIKYLSRQHELVVVSLATRREEAASEALRAICPNLNIFWRASKGDWLRLARGLIATPPGASARYWDPAAGEFLRNAISTHVPDLVEFHHLNSAIYREYAGSVPVVLREHNVEVKVWERYAETAPSLIEKAFAKLTVPRLRRYEAGRAAGFDRCLVVSQADAGYLRQISPRARIEIIPSGVDTEYFSPCSEVAVEPYRMVLTGSFEWKPKQHNLRVLLTKIMPRIRSKLPRATLFVVGKGVPADLRTLAERIPGVTVTGLVPDVRPYVWQASLVVNYLESGGGIALKVLEAMAMKKPVLSNSLGCEGIEVEHGRDVFLADGPDSFAEAAVNLLNNQSQRNLLSEFGRKKVERMYSWAVIAGQLTRCYESILAKRSGHGRSIRSVPSSAVSVASAK